MTNTSTAYRLAAQRIVVLNPDTDHAIRVYPTGEVRECDGVEYVVYRNTPADTESGLFGYVTEMRPAKQFAFVI